MADLYAGMRIEVITVTMAGPGDTSHMTELEGMFEAYTGPGSRRMWGFTSGWSSARKEPFVYVDLMLCNECAADPVAYTSVRDKTIHNTDGTGVFMRRVTPASGTWGCQACGQRGDDW
jgi:hypothetical protein